MIPPKRSSQVRYCMNQQTRKQNIDYKVKIHLGIIVLVLVILGNGHVSLTENSLTSITWEQTCKSYLGTLVQISLRIILPVSLGNSCASLTLKQSCQCHLGTMVLVSYGISCASVFWGQSC